MYYNVRNGEEATMKHYNMYVVPVQPVCGQAETGTMGYNVGNEEETEQDIITCL